MKKELIVTVDIDWACEAAIEETLDFLIQNNIKPTVFTTHPSAIIESSLKKIDVGLHPYFDINSSQGSTTSEVVKYVLDLPHNLPAYRCHRFGICNTSRQAMAEAGMRLSSNVCTDLEIVLPFKDRFGLLEVPIFLEDGGYLWRKHPLHLTQPLISKILKEGYKIIIIHPMHFCLNTPHFSYMYDIKQSIKRDEWKEMSRNTLNQLRWKDRGIRDFLVELLQLPSKKGFLRDLIAAA